MTEQDQPMATNSIALKIMAILGVASIFVWVGAIIVGPSIVPTGQLSDEEFPKAAEAVCETSAEAAGDLPIAREAETPEQRAAVIDQSADIYSDMTSQLAVLADDVADPTEREFVKEWVDDWNLHIEDRRDYAQRLRDLGEAEVFLESTKEDKQVSRAVNRYAEINHMVSCSIPGDL